MNRSWVRFPQAAQIRPPGSGWAFLHARVVLLVAPLVFRAPSGPTAVCAGGRRPAPLMVLLLAPRVFRAPEGPAAREARQPHFVRRRASKPARALRSLRRPSHLWGLVCWRVAGHVGSLSGQAPPPPTGTAARPSGPSGALHTSGAWCADGDPRHLESPARPLYSPWASQEPRVLIFWDTPKRVVTNVVIWGCFSCGFLCRCYKRRQSEGFFAENTGFWA